MAFDPDIDLVVESNKLCIKNICFASKVFTDANESDGLHVKIRKTVHVHALCASAQNMASLIMEDFGKIESLGWRNAMAKTDKKLAENPIVRRIMALLRKQKKDGEGAYGLSCGIVGKHVEMEALWKQRIFEIC